MKSLLSGKPLPGNNVCLLCIWVTLSTPAWLCLLPCQPRHFPLAAGRGREDHQVAGSGGREQSARTHCASTQRASTHPAWGSILPGCAAQALPPAGWFCRGEAGRHAVPEAGQGIFSRAEQSRAEQLSFPSCSALESVVHEGHHLGEPLFRYWGILRA